MLDLLLDETLNYK